MSECPNCDHPEEMHEVMFSPYLRSDEKRAWVRTRFCYTDDEICTCNYSVVCLGEIDDTSEAYKRWRAGL